MIPTNADNERRITALEAEPREARARIAELERVVNRTLPRGAQIGPDKPPKIVELEK